MDLTLANTMQGLAHYVREFPPDLIVVHGDRVEALAGAIVGALNNVLVAHIEGGELSGTVDELIRHAITKLSHLHFVANAEARERLIQMGEIPGQHLHHRVAGHRRDALQRPAPVGGGQGAVRHPLRPVLPSSPTTRSPPSCPG